MRNEKFHAWVKKWDVGRGMNDRDDVKNYSGFDGTVGEGWVLILDRLAEDLVKMGWDRSLLQVKEKFGTLRFHIDKGTDEMYKRIVVAENESEVTCEDCGAPGTQTKTRWIRTLCKECEKKEK